MNDTEEKCVSNIINNKEYKETVSFVLNKMADSVVHTLGPYGGYTLIPDYNHSYAATLPSKDGMRLVEQFKFTNQIADSIYRLVSDTSLRINDRVGDGTTSAIMITRALFKKIEEDIVSANRQIKDPIAPTAIQHLLDACKKVITKHLNDDYIYQFDSLSKELQDEVIAKVCAVSANNDPETGALVSDIVKERQGSEVYITAEHSGSDETKTIRDTGFEFGSGIISQAMVTEPDRITCRFTNPRYLIIDGPLTASDKDNFDIFFSYIVEHLNQPLVVIAGEYDQFMKNYLISLASGHGVTNEQGQIDKIQKFPVAALHINSSYQGSKQRIEDLCLILDAVQVPTKDGQMINVSNNIQLLEKFLGASERFESVIMRSRIFGGHGDKKAIRARIDSLTEDLNDLSVTDDTQITFTIDAIKKRIAMLNSDMAMIRVGGRSVKEKESRKLLVDDAIFAAKSTLNHGVTIGANTSIPHLIKNKSKELQDEIYKVLCDSSQNIIIGNNEEDVYRAIDVVIGCIAEAFKDGYANVLKNAYGENVKKIDEITKKIYDNTFPAAFNLVTGHYEELHVNDVELIKENSLFVPGNTDIELLDAACMIVGLLNATNQMMTIFPGEVKMYQPPTSKK